jgi:uncharacterized protein YndB with AHSA1/START domain
MTNTIDIKATPDRVWALLADLTGTRAWLPGVVAARVDGSVRICRMADGQEVQEEISNLAPDRRSYRFRYVQVPLPINDAGGAFSVIDGPTPETATVVLQTSFEPLDPAAAEEVTTMIRQAFQQALESLRRFIEHGVTWYGA